LRPLARSLRSSLAAATTEHEQNISQAEDYLRGRGIEPALSARFRLGFVSESSTHNPEMAGRLAIPSLLDDGGVYNIRFRKISEEKQGPKYLGLPGHEVRLFNVRAISEAHDTICITEGELDSVVLEGLGYHSVGVCGANSWQRHHPRMFAGFQRVFVIGDGDDAGRGFAERVAGSVLSAHRVRMPVGMDVTDVFLADGEDGIHNLLSVEDE
jgi:DNA primase